MIRRARGWTLSLMILVTGASVARAVDDVAKVVGEWKTTRGPLALEAKGTELTGRFVAFNIPVKGQIKDGKLVLGFEEGPNHYDATLDVDAENRSFTGFSVDQNGKNRNGWSGWKFDKAALNGPVADFSGLWLTNLGLMELVRDGSKFRGKYALRGGSTIEGEAKGRHLDAKIKAARTGPAAFDLAPDGSSFFGAGGTDGMAPWYSWNGRRATNFAKHAPLKAGEMVDGATDGLLTYTVRAPEGYKEGDGKKWPTIVILHGSNMNGRAYVNTIAQSAPEVAKEYILLGVNGEIPTRTDPADPAFNYSYINYMGRSTYKGFPGTDRESPALVREAMEELRKVYPVQHYFIGGHSQGAYLCYSMLMHSPELLAGAFPMAGEVMIQNEPAVFDDAPTKAAQRAVPLAIVHSKNDPVIDISSGLYGYGLFLDAGWPALHLFSDEKAGHMFAFLPITAAVRWLETMNSDDPKILIPFIETSFKEKNMRDALAALRRTKKLKLDAASKSRLEKTSKQIEGLAANKTQTFLPALKNKKGFRQIDDFLAFRDQYEYADSAQEAMKLFDALRAEQNEPAQKLMGEARGLFNQNQRPDGYKKVEEVVEKYPASTSYRLAKKWLAERN